MDEVAELGVAAHWCYKQNVNPHEGRQYRWLRELLDIHEHASGPEEFLEHTKLEMFRDQVFCFTPHGDLIALPQGATPIDFAYAVHTEIGNTCNGAKVNGRVVPLRARLSNGDQVDIIRAKHHTASPAWEDVVVTGKARACIRRFIRTRQREEFIDLGRNILRKTFSKEDVAFTEKALGEILNKFDCQSIDDIYAAVGSGLLSGHEIIRGLFPDFLGHDDDEGKVVSLSKVRGKRSRKEFAVPIKGLIPGVAVHFAGCCHPIPGDRIVGITNTGKGVTIHTIDCESLEKFADEPEKWLDVAWDSVSVGEETHVGRLNIVLLNEAGSLGMLSTVIGKNRSNITNLSIINRSTDFFEMVIDLEVKDVKHLADIIAALRANPKINSVERARG
jgi:GTP pyrophosphokinase